MKNKWLLLSILSLIALAALTSSFISFQRMMVEKQNNIIELVIDYTDAERLALNEGVSVEDVLQRLMDAGITSVAITENTLIDAEKEGSIFLSPGYTLKPRLYKPDKIYLFIQSYAATPKLIEGLSIAFAAKSIRQTDGAIELSSDEEGIFLKGIGLSAKKVKTARSLGLRVIPRLKNSYNMNNDSINRKIKMTEALTPFETVIFDGEEVLGYPNYVKESAKALKENNVRYGYIELAKQSGDSALLRSQGLKIIKLHSISGDELGTMTKAAAAQRFIRAAQDRGIRMLYLHTYPYPDKDRTAMETNVAIVERIRSGLQGKGFFFGKASAPEELSINKIQLTILALGAAAGALLLISYLTGISPLLAAAVFILTIFLSATLDSMLIRKLFALLAAVTFPTFAVVSMYTVKKPDAEHGVLATSIFAVLYMAGITFLGGMLIAGLLADTTFLMGINRFSGVKLALILPILIVAVYFFLRDDKGTIDIKKAKSRIAAILSLKITILNGSLILFGLATVALLLLRSGNFGLPILIFEKIFRRSLEAFLVIRPRTKEFLVGYPALLLGTIYHLKGGRAWLPVWAAAGMLALVSMTNTFCHIHSPLTITMIRSTYGLFLGLTLGTIIYAIYYLITPTLKKLFKA
ncbi:DUF5693 family protein [Candidatus Margulisiibacteriota bacterium]